jgi:glycosyltransferase involved in cell wall biosynthesis
MSDSQQQPLVTFALFAYNQERFVRAAVEGALTQTYSPLEIVLSDDCSTDNTFAIMEELAGSYNGPHTIRLRKNDINVGLARHFNEVMALVHGEFVVTAAGDDISEPKRTQVLTDSWLKNNKNPCSIFSNAFVVDENGKTTGFFFNNLKCSKNIDDFIKSGHCFVGGFAHGFSTRLYENYGPISEKTFQEDAIISFRAIMNSGIVYLDEPLVYYRRHEQNSFSVTSYGKFKHLCKSEYAYSQARLDDFGLHVGLAPHKSRAVRKVLRSAVVKAFIISEVPGFSRLYFLAKVIKMHIRILRSELSRNIAQRQ